MIALIDYGMGNLLSVLKALEHVGGKIEICSDAASIKKADAVILPGVGNFGDGMENLYSRNLAQPVKDAVAAGKPLLGICLGMQMLMEASEEAPGVEGLGIFKGKSVKFPSNGLKVPHIGWNSVKVTQKRKELESVHDGEFFYFVHSYYVKPEDSSITALSCSYGLDFAAALGAGNVFATQFHPEKSQDAGLKILQNFVIR